MKIARLLILSALLVLSAACKSGEEQEITLTSDKECVVIGDIKGLRNGIIEFQDEYDDYKVVAKGKIKNGRFIVRTEVSQPTHVYAYSDRDGQLSDFFLEPGIVYITGSKENEFNVATGTSSNDYWQAFRQEELGTAKDDLYDFYHRAYENAPDDIVRMKLLERDAWSSPERLELIRTLDPGVLSMVGVSEMQDLYTRRAKAEPNGENVYIDIQQPDPEGNIVTLKEIVEKPGNRYVMIDFWATWCGPCRAEMPAVKEAYERFHDKGFDIYAVSLDNGDRLMKQWREYIVDNNLPWVNVCSGESTQSGAYQDYALRGIPDNILIDCADGKIIDRSIHGQDFSTRLSELLD